jgi:hypothetical protein
MRYLIKLFWKVFVFLQSTKQVALLESIGNATKHHQMLWWKVSVILQTQQDALVEKGFVILQKHHKMLW